jgi:hypothetical protein
MGLRNRGRGKGGGRPVHAALSGVAICDACGARMESRRSPYVRKDGTRQAFYLCASRRHGTGTCDAPRVDAAKVDQAIMARLTAWTPDWKTWKDEQARALERERAALKAELASRQREAEHRAWMDTETCPHDASTDASDRRLVAQMSRMPWHG